MLLLARILSLGILLLQLFTESSAVEPLRFSTVRSYKLEFFEHGIKWEQAQKSCEERDSWLIEIKDEEIFNAVMKLKKHHIIWIGAYYNNGWSWNGSSPMRYENWKFKYPTTPSSRTNNFCGMMQEDGSWINIDCSKGYRYVCQSDMTYPGSFDVTFMGDDIKSFDEANKACKSSYDTRLVEIKTSALNSFIKHAISAQKIQYWTSGNDKGTEAVWKWGDGNPINISSMNWITSSGGKQEPNGGSGENCLATDYRGWSDKACTESKGYICQNNVTSGRCTNDVCSNRGTCEISNRRFVCSCESGYFGTKCEKDLITISAHPKSATLNKGQSIDVTLTVKSYDGNILVSYKRDTGKLVPSETYAIARPGNSNTTKFSLGIQLQSVTYHFDASSVSKTYSRKDTISISVIDHCESTPCKNGGTCSYSLSNPYYTCACNFENEGLTCEGNRSFVTDGNCKYHMKNDTVIRADNATAICQSLGGSLAMIKTRQIQDFLQQEITAKFGDAADELWAGGHSDGEVWYWMDGTQINFTSPLQDFSGTQQNFLAISFASGSGQIRWKSKQKSNTTNGYICEVAVQDPCSLMKCSNGGSCVVVGCQANCNCAPGFYDDLCQKDRIVVSADHPNYTTIQNLNVVVRLRITSNHGPVKIEVYRGSFSAGALQSQRNITNSTTFTIGPMTNQTEGLQYIFKATPESDTENYFKLANITIIVQGPPSIASIHDDVLSLPTEASIVVQCNASGVPQPSITWKKDGVEVTTSGSSPVYQSKGNKFSNLNFTSEAKTEVGYYNCYAQNEMNNGEKKSVNESIFVRGKIKLVENTTTNTESAVDSIALSCTFEGYPGPAIFWKWGDGKEIPLNKAGSIFIIHTTVVNSDSPLVRKKSSLNIALVEYLGSTNVSCYSRNEYENCTGATFPLNQDVLTRNNRSYRLYTVSDEMKSYSDAQTYCKDSRRSLVKILDNETQYFIANRLSARNLPTKATVFIGAQKQNMRDVELWKWVDGKIFYNETKYGSAQNIDTDYSAWHGGGPNGTGNCAVLKHDMNWLWTPEPCNTPHAFICESEVAGVPRDLKVTAEICRSIVNVSWITAKEAVGVTHRIELHKVINDSFSRVSSPQNVIPDKEDRFTTYFSSLENGTLYTVMVIVCPECPYPHTTSTTVSTNELMPSSAYKITNATVARVSQSCVFSWSIDDSADGIIGYRINTSTTLVHSASAKGRLWSAREEHDVGKSIHNHNVSAQFNRKYTFRVQIRTCLDLGLPAVIRASCLVERGPPASVSRPTTLTGNDGKRIVQIAIPDESNGPISCLFIIVINGAAAINKTNFGSNDLANAMLNSRSETLVDNAAYIAIAIPRQDISTAIEQGINFTRGLGNAGAISSCDITTDYSKRKKRSVATTDIFEGRNRDLPAGKSFGVFTITSTPGNNSKIFFQTSETTVFAVPPYDSGAIIGIISVAIIVTVALVIVTVYLIKRKRDAKVKDEFTINMEDLNQEQEQHVYANLAFDNREPRSETEIPVDQLRPIYNSMKARNSHDFQDEFQKLKEDAKALPYLTMVASAVTVSMKNRYRNILPSDQSRVVLSGEGDSTYINASFVDGYSKNRKFIATQGPLPNTVNDFWKMIFEQKCTVVVMLANCVENGRIKCEKYWPDRGISKIYGDIKIENENETSCGSYKLRKFMISKEEEVMNVHQFHFLSWPDHGVPVTTTNLLRFYNALMKHQAKSAIDSPIVVHCSAGAGRTGTLIAYDYVLEEAKARSFVDIFGGVINLRAQRVDMVQTCGQYILVHKLLLEHHLLGETDVEAGSLDDLVQSSNGRSKLHEQFEKLGLVGPVNQMKHGDVSKNRAMNRNGDIVPYEANKTIILKQVDEMDVPYLNASTIETHGGFIKLIAAQGPLKSSVDYFWRGIMDNGVNIIVMLTRCMEHKKEQCFQYWPESSERDVLAKDIIVHLESETGNRDIVQREFTVFRQDEKRTIKHYQYTRWSSDECPEDPRKVLDLISYVREDPGKKLGGGAIVHCSDGAGRTGSFCAILNLIERLKYEDKVDIFRSVKDLRDCRPGMVQTFEQFLFCHMAISTYIESEDP